MQQAQSRGSQAAVSCSPHCAPPLPLQRPTHRAQLRINRWQSGARCVCTAAAVEELQGSQEDQLPQAPQAPFKYKRLPCSSPCRVGDVRCYQVEALFQHVLNFPRIPTRVCQWLPTVETDMATITRTVEGLSHKYGQELTILFLRRSPHLLQHDLETLTARAEHARSMLDLKPAEVYMILRKNPAIFCVEAQMLRARYNALHKVLPLSHDAIKALVRKFPLILNFKTSTVEEIMDALRQVSYTRINWQEDFDNITPSQLAYFFRDSNDIMERLEYLVASGSLPFIRLAEVFKMTNNIFARRNRGFDAWLEERAVVQQRRMMMMQQQQEKRAQQAAVLARLRLNEPGAGEAGQQGGQQQAWQQELQQEAGQRQMPPQQNRRR